MPAYNAHQVTREFEAALCEYTGAPYAVSVSSCTMALLLAVRWCIGHRPKPDVRRQPEIEIPKRTYVSVPMSIIHAGGRPTFRDEDWRGAYQLKPLPVWDSARWFTGNLWPTITQGQGGFVCCSFHHAKTLGDTQGGAILHGNSEADAWLRRARFDGRAEGAAPKDDTFTQIGWHCYLSPDVSARLLQHLSSLPKHNAPLANDDYPALDEMEIFR